MKIGDKIRLRKGSAFYEQHNGVGEIIGMVPLLSDPLSFKFKLKFGNWYGGYYKEEDLELVNDDDKKTITIKENMLNNIPKRIKKLLNKDLRAMYKLDWIDEDLNLTLEGINQLMQILHNEYQEKLGALAQEEIKKIEKEN